MHPKIQRTWLVRFGIVLTCVLLVAACGHDTTAPSTGQSFYWQLQLNHHSVTLATVAPYDTIHLAVTPLDVNGKLLPTTAHPVYTASDTSVTVDSSGLVQVHWSGSDAPPVTVISQLSVGDAHPVTLADTVVINIVDWSSASAVPTLDSLIFRPVAGDSARRAVIDTTAAQGTQIFDSAIAKTANGAVIPNVLVRYKSSDSLIASFASPTSTTAPQVTANQPGVVLLTAEATVYGKRRVDSLWYVVGYPLRVVVSYGTGELSNYVGPGNPLPSNYLTRGAVEVGQGGAVLWGNSIDGTTHDSLNIHFDDSTRISGLADTAQFPGLYGPFKIPPGSGGNIPAFPAGVQFLSNTFVTLLYDSTSSKARVFTEPGIYQWSSTLQGISGTVTAISNDSVFRTRSTKHVSNRLLQTAP